MLHLDEPIAPAERRPRRRRRSRRRRACSCSVRAPPACPRRSVTPTAHSRAAVGHWRDALGLTDADRLQIITPPSHILGLLNIATVLDTGGWMRLHRRFDVDSMLAHIESDRITVEMAVAPIALAMASHPDLERYDLSSLRYIMWCATPVTESVARRSPAAPASAGSPPTAPANCPCISCNQLDGARLDTVGRPVPGVELRSRVTGDRATRCPRARWVRSVARRIR